MKRGGSGYDTDFQAWLDYNALQGHYMTSDTVKLDAANQYVLDLKSNGFWGKKDTHHMFAWNDLDMDDASLVCFKRRIKAVVYGGVTYTLQGWLGNGSNGYIDLLFTPSTDGVNYQQNNASRTYVPFGSWLNLRAVCGHSSSVIDREYPSNSIQTANINGAGNYTSNADTRGSGIKSANRTSSVDVEYTNQTTFTNLVGNLGSVLSTESYLLFQASGVVNGNGGISHFSLGSKLTQAEVQDYRTVLNDYFTLIGLTAIA